MNTISLISPDLRDPLWGTPVWPRKFSELRSHQLVAIEQIIDAYERGIDIVVVDAPTGSGKSAIGEATRRLLKPENSLYVCHTIGLQEQFVNDFPYARLLKGRSNYATADKPNLFGGKLSLSAADCNYTRGGQCGNCDDVWDDGAAIDDDNPHCDHCHPVWDCPYRVAKSALMSKDCPIGVTNTAYFLTEANFAQGLTGRAFTIADECDTLHKILLDQITVHLSQSRVKKYDIKPPEKKTVESSWSEWLTHEAIPKLKEALAAHSATFAGRKPDVTQAREFKYLTGMLAKLYTLPSELEAGNIVYDGYETGDIIFKPIHANRHAPSMLWKHSNKWLLMSASVIDPTGEMLRLGADKAGLRWEVITVPSTFDVARRPIHVKPVADMSFKMKAEEWPKMVKGIQSVIEAHPIDRILVHTVSYEFMNYVVDNLVTSRDVLYYKHAQERDYTLRKFRKTDGGILLAPSMDRGISLDDDDCRVVVIPKVPNLNINDKVVKKRLYAPGGQLWYRVETLRTLVQMTGRAMRSETDYASSYILDQQFVKIYKESHGLLPKWWRDSLDFSGGATVTVKSD